MQQCRHAHVRHFWHPKHALCLCTHANGAMTPMTHLSIQKADVVHFTSLKSQCSKHTGLPATLHHCRAGQLYTPLPSPVTCMGRPTPNTDVPHMMLLYMLHATSVTILRPANRATHAAAQTAPAQSSSPCKVQPHNAYCTTVHRSTPPMANARTPPHPKQNTLGTNSQAGHPWVGPHAAHHPAGPDPGSPPHTPRREKGGTSGLRTTRHPIHFGGGQYSCHHICFTALLHALLPVTNLHIHASTVPAASTDCTAPGAC